jgi:hypothetical protein
MKESINEKNLRGDCKECGAFMRRYIKKVVKRKEVRRAITIRKAEFLPL